MDYHLYPPFFRIEPQTSFDEAWEVFCCELLNLEQSTHAIRRRTPPDLGADLIWEQEGIVYQCKAAEYGQPGSLNLSKIKNSIDKAQENRSILGWYSYALCTNVDLTGEQERKLREYLPGIELLSRLYWIGLCKKFSSQIADRFYTLTSVTAQDDNSGVWNVPFRRNPFFTGRQNILEVISSRLHTPSPYPQAITGLGGVGKTQVAAEYAYRHRHEYNTVLWFNATTYSNLLGDFIKATTLLHLPMQSEPDPKVIVEEVKEWLRRHSDWLLIFDNADDLELLYDFLPAEDKGHILFTSRDQVTGYIANSIQLEKMLKEEGILMLLRRAKLLVPHAPLTSASQKDRLDAEAIATEMDCLPLALDQAGAYIEETKCSLPHYLQLYQKQRMELLKRRGRLPNGYSESVATTWLLSFDKVKQVNANAAELLRFCAFFHPDSIPEEIVGVGHMSTLDEDIGTLLRFSLVRRDSDTRMLTIHRLVQTVLMDEMDQGTKTIWAELAIRVLEKAFPQEAKIASWPVCQRYLPHAVVGVSFIEKYGLIFAESGRLLYILGYYMQETARYQAAKQFYEQALDIFERVDGFESANVASVLHELARLSLAQGRYNDAENLYRKAMHIYEQTLKPDHPNIASTKHELARLFLTLKRFDAAQLLLHQALSVREQVLGPDHPDTAATLHELALLYQYQGRFEDARQLLERVLSIEEKNLGPDHPDIATTLHNLAAICEEQEQFEQAQSLYERALYLNEQALGADHPSIVGTLNNLATLYRNQKQYASAEELYKRALRLCEQALGEGHPSIIRIAANLAVVYDEQREDEQAEALYKRALDLSEREYGLEHVDTIVIMDKLALLYLVQKRYELAEQFYKRILSLWRQILEPEDTHIVLTLQRLTELYLAQDKYQEAEYYIRQVVSIEENILGPEHPDLVSILQILAFIYLLEGFTQKAILMYERILSINAKILGQEHLEAKAVRERLASLSEAMNWSQDSKSLEQGTGA